MGVTKQYLRYTHADVCNVVGSAAGAVVAIDQQSCAVAACDNVNIYNMRTTEKVYSMRNEKKLVTAVKLSSDKRYLAIGYNDGSLRLYDRKAEDQSAFVALVGHRTGVNCIAFSNDGLSIATGGKDSTVVVWDIVSESGIVRLHGHKDSITHLQFTPDDRFIVSASKDTFVKMWHIESHSCFYTICDSRSEVYSFSLLKQGRLLVTASAELELLVYDLEWLNRGVAETNVSGETRDKRAKDEEGDSGIDEGEMANRYVRVFLRGRLLRQSKGRALQLVASSDERILLCLGSGQTIDVFRVYTDGEAQKRLSKKMRKAKRKAGEGEATPTADDVAKDVTVQIARIGEYRAMKDKVKWADFAPMAVRSSELGKAENRGEMEGDEEENEGAKKKKEKKRKAKNGEEKMEVDGKEEGDEDKDRRYVYTTFVLTRSNTVQRVRITVDFDSNETTADLVENLDKLGHRDDVRSLAVSSSNAAFASGGGDQVIIWNMNTLKPVNGLREPGMADVTAVAFATGDNHIVAGTKDGNLFLFALGAAECLEVRKGAHEGAVWAIVPNTDKKGFVTCSADKTVKFWSYVLVEDTGRKRLTLRESRVLSVPDEATCLALSPDGKFLVVGLLNSTLSVYFVDTLKFFLSLYGHSLPVTAVSISPDSKLVVSGAADKTIKIWGLDFGDCHKSFHAHDEAITSVLFSPSEEMLVWSAGRDGKIKQWDAVKRERVQVLTHHSAEVWALAQTSDGNVMLSASHDKSIRCWEQTEEIIVLEEEEELEREEEYDAKFLDEDDVIAGETRVRTGADEEADAAGGRGGAVASLAAAKNKQSIASTEQICEAVEIVRKERVEGEADKDHKLHPLIKALGSKSLDNFLVDVISRVQPSNLERALLLVPFSFVPDIVKSLCAAVSAHYKLEMASRVAIYLLRIHHAQVTNSRELLPLIDRLRVEMKKGVEEVKETVGMNMAALRLLQAEYEERQEVKLYDESSILNPRKAKNKKKGKERKAVVKQMV